MSVGSSAVSTATVMCEVCCWHKCSYVTPVRGRAVILSHASCSDASPLSGYVSLTVFQNGLPEFASTCCRSSDTEHRVKWLEQCCVPVVLVFKEVEARGSPTIKKLELHLGNEVRLWLKETKLWLKEQKHNNGRKQPRLGDGSVIQVLAGQA